jgi:acyl carrier protein
MLEPPLNELIANTLGIPIAQITEASSMENTPKWDSLRQMIVMTELELNYGVELTNEEMTDANSIVKLRELLRRKGRE